MKRLKKKAGWEGWLLWWWYRCDEKCDVYGVEMMAYPVKVVWQRCLKDVPPPSINFTISPLYKYKKPDSDLPPEQPCLDGWMDAFASLESKG